MKYLLMFCGTQEDRDRVATMAADVHEREFGKVMQWLQELGPKIVTSGRLQPPASATTVRFDAEGVASVTDGPFIEAKEAIGGYAVVELADLDEALRVARAWPARGSVEIRPLVDGPR
jgi:hypothetical protein